MSLGDWIDGLIEPFSPRMAAQRRVARIGLEAVRSYDGAARDRRTQGWKRPATSQDAEGYRGRAMLAYGARDLVRNNKYASAAVRQIAANIVGDGIAPQAVHEDPNVVRKAQDDWDRWAESPVDGFGDFYEVEKLHARGMAESGEALNVWRENDGEPNARVTVLEADFLDETRNEEHASGARVVQGVSFNPKGDRDAFWLRGAHPGDQSSYAAIQSSPVSAAYVDHVFERLRPGQTRGVSWLASSAMTLRDIADIEDAVRLKKKVQACLSLILTPASGDASPLTNEVTAQGDKRPDIETLRPGMILRTRPDEQVSTVSPSSDGDGVDFIRQQLAAVSANLVPYHVMTGDVSQANYSSLRAALLGHWALLDDWQQNVMIPRLVAPAFRRRMRVLALKTGDKRFLEVRAHYALPVRRFVDPVKDLLGEVMEIRAGLKLLSQSLAERGINAEDHMAHIAKMNAIIDQLGLALESDPRRLTDSGVLQAAAGYLRPQGA